MLLQRSAHCGAWVLGNKHDQVDPTLCHPPAVGMGMLDCLTPMLCDACWPLTGVDALQRLAAGDRGCHAQHRGSRLACGEPLHALQHLLGPQLLL